VVVFLLHENATSTDSLESSLVMQQERLSTFLKEQSQLQLIKDFYQIVKKQKNKNKWLLVQEALELCKNNNYDLIIPELKQHYGHLTLGKLLQSYYSQPHHSHALICLDQPLTHASNISEIIEDLRQRRKKHGELIKQGLTQSDLKSGNPKAAEIIQRVNRPKILFSILFSLLIEPVVEMMEEKKLAQRKMVAYLNQHDFFAPEGGRWVLSQFQKVYDRLKLNRLALAVRKKIEGAEINAELIHDLNLVSHHLLSKGKTWDHQLIQQAQERLRDLEELELMLKGKKSLEELLGSQLLEEITMKDLLSQSEITLIMSSLEQEYSLNLKTA
jgi:hypothetical protein